MQVTGLVKTSAFLTAFLLLQSCSIFKSSTSSSLTLPQPSAAVSPALVLEQLAGTTPVYKLKNPAGSELYLTGIRDCGGARERVSAAATTRQLLVGLKDLMILNQKSESLGGQEVFVSSIQARLDEIPLRIECYTLRRGNCTFDLVSWNRLEGSAGDTFPFFPSALNYLEQVLPEIAA